MSKNTIDKLLKRAKRRPYYWVDQLDLALHELRLETDRAIEAINAALANTKGFLESEETKPEREWVGLTEDEIYNITKSIDPKLYRIFAKAIESKLKAKNT